jgi:hypothetical protein
MQLRDCAANKTHAYGGNIKYACQDEFNEYLEYIVISLYYN